MDNKLCATSIKLIEGLISADLRYRQEKLKALVKDKETADLLGTVNPAFELAEALEMDLDFIEKNIIAVLNGKITEQECSQRIIEHYEDCYFDKMIDKQQFWDSGYEEIREWI